MTVHRLTVEIDDALPLGPQLAAARSRGVPWKLLQPLAGGLSVRHLQNLVASSHFCERQEITASGSVSGGQEPLQEGHVMLASPR